MKIAKGPSINDVIRFSRLFNYYLCVINFSPILTPPHALCVEMGFYKAICNETRWNCGAKVWSYLYQIRCKIKQKLILRQFLSIFGSFPYFKASFYENWHKIRKWNVEAKKHKCAPPDSSGPVVVLDHVLMNVTSMSMSTNCRN